MRVTLNFPAFHSQPAYAHCIEFRDGAIPRQGDVIKVWHQAPFPTHILERGTFQVMTVHWEIGDRGCDDVQVYLAI